jgi:hypothetical protein
MASRTAFRYWLLALVLCAIAVEVCIAYVDRALAEFIEAHLRHTELSIWLDRMLRPLDLVVVIALFFLLGCGIWVVSSRELRPWTETPLLCAWSAIWAVAADIILKHIFGRAWPDPTYVHFIFMGSASCVATRTWVLSPRERRPFPLRSRRCSGS